MVSVVLANEEDIGRILEIEAEAISPPWTHGALLGEIYRDDSFFAVASEDGVCQGFIILRCMADEGELLQIAVDKTARRRGIADLLTKAALRFADESTLKAVFLEVRKSNYAAIALYNKHGFCPVRVRKDYYCEPIEDAVVMECKSSL